MWSRCSCDHPDEIRVIGATVCCPPVKEVEMSPRRSASKYAMQASVLVSASPRPHPPRALGPVRPRGVGSLLFVTMLCPPANAR